MKALFFAIALTLSASIASASCADLISLKAAWAQELSVLAERISSSTNSDKIDFYMDQYDSLSERYQNLVETINKDCRQGR